ncbi:hypothetical protein BN14_11053 [Rhizoctonia solani AG-1 IB]|uniref:Uncharacterized protein n=1 Tax=Thanatephorus cucumeris (strain AG1-IB / isolate 7/3/14) TaxID=1108050 RepID=M5CBS9_THACB|nr:hypothetical protein BN14_11053 [Rhizoctonia solani AG-1 IB]
MELDGSNEKTDMYNAINTYARTILMAEVKDLENPIWANVTTNMRNRLNFRLKKRFPYLHRFKDNCVSEELCKRILRNHRDTMSRIKKAGGRTEWKMQEKVKRETRKAKAASGSNAGGASESTMRSSTPTPTTTSKNPGSESPVAQANNRVKEGKKAAPPTDDEETHGVSSDKQRPQKKRRRIVNDSDDSDSPGPSRHDSTMKEFVPLISSQPAKARKISSKTDLDGDGDGDEVGTGTGRGRGDDDGDSDDNSDGEGEGNNRGKKVEENEDGSEGEGNNEGQMDKGDKEDDEDDKEDDEDEDEDEDEEDLVRQMEELKKRIDAASKKSGKHNPLSIIPIQKQPRQFPDDLPSRNATPASDPPTVPASDFPAHNPQFGSTIPSNIPPSSNHSKPQLVAPSPKRFRVKFNVGQGEARLGPEERSESSTEPTPTPATQGKNTARSTKGPASRKMKEELIESVEAGLK